MGSAVGLGSLSSRGCAGTDAHAGGEEGRLGGSSFVSNASGSVMIGNCTVVSADPRTGPWGTTVGKAGSSTAGAGTASVVMLAGGGTGGMGSIDEGAGTGGWLSTTCSFSIVVVSSASVLLLSVSSCDGSVGGAVASCTCE